MYILIKLICTSESGIEVGNSGGGGSGNGGS